MGGCLSKDCDNIARDIWSWAIAQHNWLSASYTPGKHNIIADKLSREFNMTLEWKLNTVIFDKISYHFSKPGIDAFLPAGSITSLIFTFHGNQTQGRHLLMHSPSTGHCLLTVSLFRHFA
jgi:hypothetical protein